MATGFLTGLQAMGKAAVGMFSNVTDRTAYGMMVGLFPGSAGVPPKQGTAGLLAAYSTMPWVRAVVHKIAHAVATTDWVVYRPGTSRASTRTKLKAVGKLSGSLRTRALRAMVDNGDAEPIVGHEIVELFNSANPQMSGLALRHLLQVYLELVGEGFLVKERTSPKKPPYAIWPIPPNWVMEIPTLKVPAYRISYRGWQPSIPETEVYWLKTHDPLKPYERGSGFGGAVGDEAETDELTAKHLKQFFYNQARPDIIMTVPGARQDELLRMQQRWVQEHQGFWRVYKPHFLNREVKIEQLEHSFRNMQLVQLREHQRNVILQTWGMPPEKMGILENSNRATIDGADYIFAKDLIVPRLEFQRAYFQEFLVPEFDEALVIDFISPVREDREFLLRVASAAPWSRRLDEWREMQGLPPDPKSGKFYVVPSGLVAVSNFKEGPVAPPPPPPPQLGPGAPGRPNALKPGDAPGGGKLPGSEEDVEAAPKDDAKKEPAKAFQPTSAAVHGRLMGWAKALYEMGADALGHEGLLIAAWLDPETAKHLAVKGGEPADNLHITLAYIPNAHSLGDVGVASVLLATHAIAQTGDVLTGKVGGVGRFAASPESEHRDVCVALVDVPGLSTLRSRLATFLGDTGFPVSDAHDYTPHITLAYVKPGDAMPVESAPDTSLTVKALTVKIGSRFATIPLGASLDEVVPTRVTKASSNGHAEPSRPEVRRALNPF